MIRPGDSYIVSFATNDLTGAAVNADSTPTAKLYRNGVLDANITPLITNPETGAYFAGFTIPVNYAEGDILALLVLATIGGTATKQFKWEYKLDSLKVYPDRK